MDIKKQANSDQSSLSDTCFVISSDDALVNFLSNVAWQKHDCPLLSQVFLIKVLY